MLHVLLFNEILALKCCGMQEFHCCRQKRKKRRKKKKILWKIRSIMKMDKMTNLKTIKHLGPK